ncbi:MAG: helix-turn-helix domain-containing protein [Thermoleophilia bacterium]
MATRRRGRLLRQEEWVDIVRRHAAGQSIKSIAKELGISRNSVRATLRRGARRATSAPRCPKQA